MTPEKPRGQRSPPTLLTEGDAPWGFAADGRRLAVSTYSQVSLAEILPPQEVQRLNGHRVGVEQMAWCRDQRHLVTMDKSFEIVVWDVERGLAVTRSAPPAGPGYADNATAVLSADARWLASARMKGAILRDLRTGAEWSWQFPGEAYGNQLADRAEGKFLLVREERVSPEGQRESVAYELKAGAPSPRRLRFAAPRARGAARTDGSAAGLHAWIEAMNAGDDAVGLPLHLAGGAGVAGTGRRESPPRELQRRRPLPRLGQRRRRGHGGRPVGPGTAGPAVRGAAPRRRLRACSSRALLAVVRGAHALLAV
jgi:hypothetical protein